MILGSHESCPARTPHNCRFSARASDLCRGTPVAPGSSWPDGRASEEKASRTNGSSSLDSTRGGPMHARRLVTLAALGAALVVPAASAFACPSRGEAQVVDDDDSRASILLAAARKA